jgi:hypothetical protein
MQWRTAEMSKNLVLRAYRFKGATIYTEITSCLMTLTTFRHRIYDLAGIVGDSC